MGDGRCFLPYKTLRTRNRTKCFCHSALHCHFAHFPLSPLQILDGIVLYCNVLYCIVLYCIVLYCIVLYCIVLYCIVLCCIVWSIIRCAYISPSPYSSSYSTVLNYQILQTDQVYHSLPEHSCDVLIVNSTIVFPKRAKDRGVFR